MTDVLRRLTATRGELPSRPAVVNAAAWAYIGTAIVNIALTVLTDVLIGIALARLDAHGEPVASSGVLVLIAVTGLIAIAYSLTLVVLALRLRAGGARARPALLTVSILSLFVIVSQGPALFLIPLLAGCGVIVTRRPITLWLRACQGLPLG